MRNGRAWYFDGVVGPNPPSRSLLAEQGSERNFTTRSLEHKLASPNHGYLSKPRSCSISGPRFLL